MDIEAVIFDMDGTLWDSAKSVAAAWSRVVSGIEDLNITVTESKVRGVMGLPMDEIAAKLFATGDEALDNEIMNSAAIMKMSICAGTAVCCTMALRKHLQRLRRNTNYS